MGLWIRCASSSVVYLKFLFSVALFLVLERWWGIASDPVVCPVCCKFGSYWQTPLATVWPCLAIRLCDYLQPCLHEGSMICELSIFMTAAFSECGVVFLWPSQCLIILQAFTCIQCMPSAGMLEQPFIQATANSAQRKICCQWHAWSLHVYHTFCTCGFAQ